MTEANTPTPIAAGDRKMTGRERLDEMEWMLDGGVHPALAAQQIGSNVVALERLAYRHGRRELAERIHADQLRALRQEPGTTTMYARVA